MGYSEVRDHVDDISTQLFKSLIYTFIDGTASLFGRNVNLGPIHSRLISLPSPRYKRPVRPSYINAMVEACKEICNTLGKQAPSGLRVVTSGDTVLASDVNSLMNCASLVPKPEPTVYLFKPSDWGTAKNYVTSNSLIFVDYNINTLTNTEVATLVSNLPLVIVNMIDTQPYHMFPAPAFYNVFYNTLVPHACQTKVDTIIDPCFRQIAGTSMNSYFDFVVFSYYKVEGIKPWACLGSPDNCYDAYKMYDSGAIIEMPNDGFWLSVTWMEKFIQAMSKCLLGIDKPTTILYLGGYTSDMPEVHECYPLDTCWQQFASRNGYKLVDLR
jgi:hypothetical protein